MLLEEIALTRSEAEALAACLTRFRLDDCKHYAGSEIEARKLQSAIGKVQSVLSELQSDTSATQHRRSSVAKP